MGVDGGNNALFDLDLPRPDIISGDFDSIRPQLIDHFRRAGSRVMCTPDQDDTDFGKAVSIVLNESVSVDGSRPQLTSIVAISSLGGRLDHVLSNINTLYQHANTIPIYLYDIEVSLSWVLTKVSASEYNEYNEAIIGPCISKIVSETLRLIAKLFIPE